MEKKKHQTVIATEDNVISFIKNDVYLFINIIRQLGSKEKFQYEDAMEMLNYQFGNSIGEELMDKVNKELEEHGIIR